jgi:Protein of unknown function (DUF3592)
MLPYIDVLIGYAIRSLIRFVRTLRSEKWPVEKGTVLSAVCRPAGSGGPVAEIGYNYIYDGEYYSGMHTKPFLLRDSAQDYVKRIIVGGKMTVRVHPAQPQKSVLVE